MNWRGIRLTITAVTLVAFVGVGTPAGADETAQVRINEVESNGGTPGDWVELTNTGTAATDVSGWILKDSDDTHVLTIPAGTTIGAGGFVALDTESAYGLGSADSARLFQPDGTLVDSYSWTAHAATTYGRCPDGAGTFVTTTTSTKAAPNDCSIPVRINEVESNGGTPGDWVELTNTGTAATDVSGWILKDSDDTHVLTIPAGTTIGAGGFVALDTESAYGLGSADSARLFQPDGTLVDSYSWTAHAATTYGRCPDGTGEFATTTAPTKGAANACAGQTPASPWPGGSAVATADEPNVFGTNMSGLAYAGHGTLWAVKNGPGTLYRLNWDGTAITSEASWALHYGDGSGDLDSEGVAVTPAGIFVSTERDNSNGGVSRPVVARFAPTAATSLNASMEWNLGSDLPPVAANSGLEGIAWIPDAFLTAHGFQDQSTGTAYNPDLYGDHGGGLFFVGLEANGLVYAYALNLAGGFTRIASAASGFPSVMDLQFEPETGHLWAVCDDTCQGRTATLDIDAQGRLAVTDVFERPSGMPNFNNEGFAVAPQSECVSGHKAVFWSDDSNDGGHALRTGTLACTDLDADDDGIDDVVDPAPNDPANETFSIGRIIDRAGRSVAISAGVRVTVGPGSAPARFQLTGGVATIALREGVYELTTLGVRVVSGEPAVVTLTSRGTPITLTVSGSVTYTETPTGLSGIQSTGPFGVRAADFVCATATVATVFIGTTANEVLAGTAGNDLIVGKGGNDTITGAGGSDCIVTGSGNDTVTTSDGDDQIAAGPGNNTVTSGSGNDSVISGSGNDTVTTGGGDDSVDAGNGNNRITTGDGDDSVTTGSGNDTIHCGDGSDRAAAGSGNNVNTGRQCEVFGD